MGFPILSDFSIKDERVIVGIGNNSKRAELSQKYFNNLSNVISNNAYVGNFAKLGRGVFIGHFAHVGILSEIDDYVVVNTKALVDHECKLGKGCFIGPHATLCGKVTVGESSFIGASAVIRNGITVKDDIIVGAGAVVVKNLTKKGTYLSVAAHKMEEKGL